MGQHSFQGLGGVGLPSSGGDALPMAKVPCEFRANRPTFVFQGKMSRGSAAPRGLGVWACRLQGVMSYPWPRSPVSFEWIGQPSVFRGKLRQAGEKPTPPPTGPRRRPAAPDVIWHIYWGQCCFQGVAGMDLPSSGDASLIIPQVPCEFRVNRPTFVFQGKMSRESAASRGMGMWSCRLQGVMPYPWPRSPVSFEPIGQPSFFRGG